MPSFVEKYGPWALVTGASAGIGEEFVRQLAERGLNVMLVARRAEKLEGIAESIKADYGVSTRVFGCDISGEDFLELIDGASADLDIGLLVNNAGAASYHGRFLNRELDLIRQSIHFSITVQLSLIHHFGNKMAERGRGGIIQVGSATGHLPMPYMVEYSSCKAFQLTMGEGLHYEMKRQGIDVLVLSPGPTKTERVDFGLEVDRVVSVGLNKLGDRPSIITGMVNKFLVNSRKYLMSRKRRLRLNGAYQETNLRRRDREAWGIGKKPAI